MPFLLGRFLSVFMKSNFMSLTHGDSQVDLRQICQCEQKDTEYNPATTTDREYSKYSPCLE